MAENKDCICPIGSEPELASTYTPRGTSDKLGDLPIYTVGHGEKAIILVYDIFGADVGRTKLMCDQFADAGFFVVLPDFFRGDAWSAGRTDTTTAEWKKNYLWTRLSNDFANQLYPYLETKGVKSVGIVGCCWGAYIAFSACASGKINAGVTFHPTLTKSHESVEELAEGVKCPQFLMPGGNDPEEVREGGVVERILRSKPFGDKVKVKTFTEMKHGWVPRGDISDPKIARDVKEAMQLAVDYFKEML